MPTVRLPAGFDMTTVQLLVAPTAIEVGVQVRDERLGVDQSITVTFCEEAPRVALTTACVFERIVPAVAVALADAFPARTVSVAGIGSREELEFSKTVVFAETAWDSVIEQVTLAPDITPVGLQTTPETSTGTGAKRLMAAVADFVGSATLVAVTVTVCEAAMIAGAVYSPAALIVPRFGVRVQVTGPPPGAPIKATVLEANVVGF
jgi:hypothetical protein